MTAAYIAYILLYTELHCLDIVLWNELDHLAVCDDCNLSFLLKPLILCMWKNMLHCNLRNVYQTNQNPSQSVMKFLIRHESQILSPYS